MARPTNKLQDSLRALEQKVELENVTDLRQNLSPIIGRLEEEPALRFLILRHGKPQAVLMSFPTYELLQKLLTMEVEKTDAMTREERVAGALKELREEKSSKRSVAAARDSKQPQVAIQVEKAMSILQQIKVELSR